MSKTVSTNQSSGGIGFFGLLGLIFITLKLLNIIAWSWLWVLAPIWIPTALVLGIIIIFLLFAILAAILK